MFKRKQNKPFSSSGRYQVGHDLAAKSVDIYRDMDDATKAAFQTATRRLTIGKWAIVGFLLFIMARLFYLTLLLPPAVKKSNPAVFMEDTRFVHKNLYDRRGVVVATSLPTTDLSVNPHKVKNPAEVARNLATIFPDMSEQELYARLTAPVNFRYIRRNITPTEENAILWQGYYFLERQESEDRFYPQGRLFSHVLGHVDIDGKGIAGLEKGLEPAIGEQSLTLSLDVALQKIVHQVLEKNIAKHKAKGGAAVVLDVQTGEVLAMVSLPDYDPNRPIPDASQRVFNRASLGTYEMGSVFKLLTVAMGLEHRTITPLKKFDVAKPLKIGRKSITDFHPVLRPLTVAEILFHSSNIGSAKIALDVGYERQREFLTRFHFHHPLAIDLPEKASVLFPRAGKAADLTVANLSYGYAISVSPLHMVAAIASLVNGGYYHTPVFLKKTQADEIEYQIISDETSAKMRAMMWGDLNWDSKPKDIARLYRVGGKTGTANLIEKGKYVQGRVRTTFVGAFPMDKPKVAFIVVMEDPQKLKENWYFNAAGWNAKQTGLEMVAQMAPVLGVCPGDTFAVPPYLQRAIDASKAAKKH